VTQLAPELDVTVVIPTHPARVTNGMLARALLSLREQLRAPADVVIQVDQDGAGAARTRNRGLSRVGTPWVAFLDSDDWFYPEHLALLVDQAAETGADYLFSYYSVYDQWEALRPDVDPLGTFGRPFDPEHPHQTTSTILVRTALALQLGFTAQPRDRVIEGTNLRYGEDWQFTLDAVAAGADIRHVPARTWAWRHHGLNSGGLAGEGDA